MDMNKKTRVLVTQRLRELGINTWNGPQMRLYRSRMKSARRDPVTGLWTCDADEPSPRLSDMAEKCRRGGK